MEVISRWFADFILFIGHGAQTFWDNLSLLNFSLQQIVLDILLVAVLFYFILKLIRGSRAVHILIGLVMLAIVFMISRALQLVTLSWLLDRFLTITLIAIPVIFQQELRMALERLGHTKFFQNQKAVQIGKMIIAIAGACETLAQEKHGALIVIQQTVPLKEYMDTGIAMDAAVSRELLLSIFNPQSPLHDGAVIMDNARVLAASCILPHSYRASGPMMGTRHKAALGLAESTDANIIVVSEEKGQISYARDGQMEKNISPSHLQELLKLALDPGKTGKQRRKYQTAK